MQLDEHAGAAVGVAYTSMLHQAIQYTSFCAMYSFKADSWQIWQLCPHNDDD